MKPQIPALNTPNRFQPRLQAQHMPIRQSQRPLTLAGFLGQHGWGIAILTAAITGLAWGLTPSRTLAAGEIQVRAEFDPILIDQGGSAVLRLDLLNNEPSSLTIPSDGLDETLPAGLELNAPGTPLTPSQNTCGLTVVRTANRLQITGGTIPAFNTGTGAPGQCLLEIPVIGKRNQPTAGNVQLQLQILAGDFKAGAFSNSQPAEPIITVRQLGNISYSMSFGPTRIPSGGRTRFSLNFDGISGKTLTGATFTNGFMIPTGFTLSGSPTNTCGGTLDTSAFPTIKLIGGTIPPGGCSFSFELDGPVIEQSYGPVSWAANDLVTDLEVSNNAGSSNTVAVEAGMKISQSFALNPVFINEASTLTIRIRNANSTAVSGATLNSIITGGGGTTADRLRLTGGTGNVSSTCPTTPAVSYTPGTGTLQFTNVSVPAATLSPAASAQIAECEIRVQVEADNTGIGTYTSAIAAGQLAANQTVAANTTLTIQDLIAGGGNGVGISYGFGPAGGPFGSYEVAASNKGRLRITLANTAGEDLTGVGIGGAGIQLETGMRLATGGAIANTCGGTVNAVLSSTQINLTGGNINRRGSCYIDVDVVSDQFKLGPGYNASIAAGLVTTNAVNGQAGRTYTNAASSSGPNYLEVTDFLNIIPVMDTATVAPGADARVRLRLTNSLDQARSALKLRYKLPFNIALTPDYFADAACGVAPSGFRVVPDGTSPSGFTLELDNISIPARGSNPSLVGNGQDGICEITFDVQAPSTPGNPTLTVPAGVLSNADDSQQNRTVRSTQFSVVPLNLNLTQTIINEERDSPGETATIVRGGEQAILTVTLTNPTSNPNLPLTTINFSDTLENANALLYPGGIATTDCTGASVIFNEATKTFGLTGANLNRGQSCSLRVPVTTLAVDQLPNNIAAGAAISAEGARSNADNDQIQVISNLGLAKAFDRTSINTGETARMTLTILNATTQNFSGNVTLDDNFPSGLLIANPPNLQASNCPASAVSAPADGATLRVRNGSVTNNSACTIQVDVTSLIANSTPGYTNTIPVGGLRGGVLQNTKAASATLVVNGATIPRPGLRLVKRATSLISPARPGFAAQTVDLSTVLVDDAGSFDNAPGWPTPIDPTSDISTYLKGAFDTSQVTAGDRPTLRSGTEIEYVGYYLSNGTVSADNVQLCDYIPANTTYVPGSMTLVKGDGTTTTITDADDADGGFITDGVAATRPGCVGAGSGKGAIVVNLGSLPNTGTTSYGQVKFKVRVD